MIQTTYKREAKTITKSGTGRSKIYMHVLYKLIILALTQRYRVFILCSFYRLLFCIQFKPSTLCMEFMENFICAFHYLSDGHEFVSGFFPP